MAMPTKLNRVPTLLTDEEFERMEKDRAETKETRSNWIRRHKLKEIENRGGKRQNAGRKAKREEGI